MLGPLEKSFNSAKLQNSPAGIYEGIELSSLPRYISYRAGLLKEKATLRFVLIVVAALFAADHATSRHEIVTLEKKLREKEFILAPGAVDNSVVSPQAVPETYVNDAVTDFVAQLGNVNPETVAAQYASVKRFMSDKLRVKFDIETADWLKQIQTDNISQLFTVSEKEVSGDREGNYKAVITGRAEYYANHQYLGYEDQVIEMQLHLIPPSSGKRWYLEIATLTWNGADTFKTKRSLQK